MGSYLDSLSNEVAAPAAAPAAPASFGNYLSSLSSPSIPVQKVDHKVVLVGKEGGAPPTTAGYLSAIGSDAKPARKQLGKKPVASSSSGGYLSQLGSSVPVKAAPVAAVAAPAPVAAAPTSGSTGPASTKDYLAILNVGTPLAGGSSTPAGAAAGYLVTCNTGTPLAGGNGVPAGAAAGYLDVLSPQAPVSSYKPPSYAPQQNVVTVETNDLASQRHGEIMKNLKTILNNQEEMKKDISQLLKNSGLTSKATYAPMSSTSMSTPSPAAVAAAPPSTGNYLAALGSASGPPKALKPIPKASSSGIGSYLSAL